MSEFEGLRAVEVEEFRLWVNESLRTVSRENAQLLSDLRAANRILHTFLMLRAEKLGHSGPSITVNFAELMKEERE